MWKKLKSFLRSWVLGPLVVESIERAVSRRTNGSRGVFTSLDVELTPPSNGAMKLHELRIAPPNETVWIPISKIRTRWASAVTYKQHQFVRYFAEGAEGLRSYYESHQPRDQMEGVFLYECSEAFVPVRFPFLRTPWGFETEYVGYGPFGVSHGVQDFGPVSDRKIRWEAKRLDHVLESIRERGFRVSNPRDPISYWLLIDDVSGCDYRAIIAGGNHRIAALAHLSWSLVPMRPAPHFQREIRLSDLDSWPGVLDGTFSAAAATAYFLSYFRSGDEQLLSGW